MSRQAKRRILNLLEAGAVSLVVVGATFAVAAASARSVDVPIYPREAGYERVDRLWVRHAPAARRARAANPGQLEYRREGRLWVKDAGRRQVGGGLSLVLTKTVGLDPNVCAITDTVAVPSGSDVTYCFEAANTGGITLVSHDLLDDQLGTILSNFSFSLPPGASVFLTQTATIGTNQVLNTATWTARDQAGAQTSDVDTALVTILQPSIVLTKTVGLDINACAVTDTIDVPNGTLVTYCYAMANTGLVTLTLHDLVDDQLGTILSGFLFSVGPGSSVFLTAAVTINNDVINTGTWTAYNPGPVDIATAMDTATVTTSIPVELVEFEVD